MAKKTYTIAKDKLENYLARFCSHHHKMMDRDKYLCDRKMPDECNADMLDKMDWHCPSDCPHWTQHKWKSCEPSKCSYVRKAIKELTSEHE